MNTINQSSLLSALTSMFQEPIHDVSYTTELLQGGTVGNVKKLSGTVLTTSGTQRFHMVLKTQKQWNRHGDPDCWRREYEIYKHGLTDTFSQFIHLPACYLLEEQDNTTQIWMEYIEGKTSEHQLHAEELALAAEYLGALQANFHLHGQFDLPYLRSYPAVCSSFDLWHGRMKSLLAQPIAGFPDTLRSQLNEYAEHADSILAYFDALPHTICQGDVHHDNLILREVNGKTVVYLIDWDSAGYGSLGEDAIDVLMEAFVYSDRDVAELPHFKQQIITGYCRGASSQGFTHTMSDTLIRNLFALSWGFRIADRYLYYKENEKQQLRLINILQLMLGDN